MLMLALQVHAVSLPVSYTLTKSGRVSVAIYDGEGRMVRELARTEPQEAGSHTLYWDGLDQAGRALPRGDYRWRLLQTQGLQAEYLFSLGTSFGDQHWPGQQGGPSAVAVDGDAVYMAASSVAGSPQAVCFTLAGAYQRAFACPEAAANVTDIALGGGDLYLLCANSGHLYVLSPRSGITRRMLKLDPPALGGSPDRLAADDRTLLAASTISGKVGWIDPATGKVLDTASVEKLADLTLLLDGQVLALSGENVVAFSRAEKTPRIVISGLITPTRLSFDRAANELFVVEGGDSQQIKCFDKDYRPLASFGRYGGRQQGLYHAEDFLAVSGIAGDGKGGFVITEGDSAPRRTAHFSHSGALLQEWYGGQLRYTYAAPDPANANYLWFDSQRGWLVQAEVDYQHRSWRPHATYRYDGLASGLVPGKTDEPGGWQVRHVGKQTYLLRAQGDPCLLRVDEKAGRLLPVMAGNGNITRDWDAQPSIVKAALGNDRNGKFHSYLWTDRNGNGQPSPTEIALSPWSASGPGWDIDEGFNFFTANTSIAGYELRALTPIWQKSIPRYPTFDAAATFALPADASKFNLAGLPTPVDACRDAEGNSYLLLHGGGDGYTAPSSDVPAHGYAWPANSIDATALVKWDARGDTLWRVGAHAARQYAPPGQLQYPVRIAGLVNGCIGVCDRIVQPCACWTEDGLYVGGIFDQRARDGRQARDYAWCAQMDAGENIFDNLALLQHDMLIGGFLLKRENGEVLFCGAGWNNCPIYRITGWERFKRQNGRLHISEEGTGAEGAGTGLHAAYIAGDDVHAEPSYEEQEAGVWFDAWKKWPDLPLINGTFSTRWSGQVEPRFTEAYTFAVYASGGIRLWIGDKLLIDNADAGGRFFSPPLPLTAGQRYPLRLLLYHATDTSEAHLCWESLSQPIEHIPACFLYPETPAPGAP